MVDDDGRQQHVAIRDNENHVMLQLPVVWRKKWVLFVLWVKYMNLSTKHEYEMISENMSICMFILGRMSELFYQMLMKQMGIGG